MNNHILHPIRLQELARNWLLEDTSSSNFSGVDTDDCVFEIFMKTPGMLAGIPFAEEVFNQLGVIQFWYKTDGDVIDSVTKIANVHGSAKNLLLAERVVLNVLSRASGIATITHKMLEILKRASWNGSLAGTHNTTPGFRMVEKYAMEIGGADMPNLSNFIMLKDNHIAVAGSIEKAVETVRKVNGVSLKIEIQCKSFEEALNAGKTNCDIIMLDNFKTEDLSVHALNIKLQYPSTLIEASGEITEQNILEVACAWVDIISSNNLVQGYPTIKFSMNVQRLN